MSPNKRFFLYIVYDKKFDRTEAQASRRGWKGGNVSLCSFEARPRGEVKEVSGRRLLKKIRKPLTCGVDGYGPTNSRATAFLCQQLGGSFCFRTFLPGRMLRSSAVWVGFRIIPPCLLLYKPPFFPGCCSLLLWIWTSPIQSGCF